MILCRKVVVFRHQLSSMQFAMYSLLSMPIVYRQIVNKALDYPPVLPPERKNKLNKKEKL